MATRPPSHHGSLRQRLDLALDRELRDGEKVIWSGPQLGRADQMDFGLYLFAIPWTAFSLFWTVMAAYGVIEIDHGGPGFLAWAFPLFGVPFIVVGLGMLAAPFLPILRRGRVLYAVTDRRVLQFNVGRKLVVKSVPANRIGLIERSEKPDGTGALKLTIYVGRDDEGDRMRDHFDIGQVRDVMGANRAIEALSS